MESTVVPLDDEPVTVCAMSRNGLVFLLPLAFACTRGMEPQSAASPSPAQRIVVLGPSTVANLFALGQGDRIVGVSDYCTVTQAEDLARIGGLADPSLERIVALQPDLVLVQGKAPRLDDLCRTLGVELKEFTTDTLEGWHTEIDWLVERLGLGEQGRILQETMREGLSGLSTDANADSPTVLLVIFRREGEASGMTVAGDTGFLDELLRAAGGHNVLQGSGQDYFELNEERLIRAAPQWILEFHTEGIDDPTRLLLEEDAKRIWRRDFPGLPAVEAGNIRTLVGKDLLIPGPNMIDTARKMQSALGSAP
ncbi:MAG: ABC transporter substrate-binding protein [Planctomycetota bacterium]